MSDERGTQTGTAFDHISGPMSLGNNAEPLWSDLVGYVGLNQDRHFTFETAGGGNEMRMYQGTLRYTRTAADANIGGLGWDCMPYVGAIELTEMDLPSGDPALRGQMKVFQSELWFQEPLGEGAGQAYTLPLGSNYLASLPFISPRTTCDTWAGYIVGTPQYYLRPWSAVATFFSSERCLPTAYGSYFRCVNADPLYGVTGGVEPTWSTAPNPGDQIADGTVLWQNVGAIARPLHNVTHGYGLWIQDLDEATHALDPANVAAVRIGGPGAVAARAQGNYGRILWPTTEITEHGDHLLAATALSLRLGGLATVDATPHYTGLDLAYDPAGKHARLEAYHPLSAAELAARIPGDTNTIYRNVEIVWPHTMAAEQLDADPAWDHWSLHFLGESVTFDSAIIGAAGLWSRAGTVKADASLGDGPAGHVFQSGYWSAGAPPVHHDATAWITGGGDAAFQIVDSTSGYKLSGETVIDEDGNATLTNVYTKSQVYTQDEVDDLLEGIAAGNAPCFTASATGSNRTFENDNDAFAVDGNGNVTFAGTLQNSAASVALHADGSIGAQSIALALGFAAPCFTASGTGSARTFENDNDGFAVNGNGDVTFAGVLQNSAASLALYANGSIGAQSIALANGVTIGGDAVLTEDECDAAYAALGHDHSGVYSPVGHSHSGVYSPVGHDHSGVYSPVAHTHDDRYYTETEVGTVEEVGGQIVTTGLLDAVRDAATGDSVSAFASHISYYHGTLSATIEYKDHSGANQSMAVLIPAS